MEEQKATESDRIILKPSVVHVKILEEGHFIDSSLDRDLGIWKLSGECKRVYQNVFQSPAVGVYPLNVDLILIQYNNNIEIFSLAKEKSMKTHKIMSLKTSFSKKQPVESKYYGIHYGKIIILDKGTLEIEEVDTKTEYDIIYALNKSEFIIAHGVNFTVQLFNSESSSLSPITSQGMIYCIQDLDQDTVAFAKNQCIQVINIRKNCIHRILQGINENFVDMLVLPDGNLMSASLTGLIRIWDKNKFKCTAKFKDSQEQVIARIQVAGPNLIMATNVQDRCIMVWDISEPQKPKTVKKINGMIKHVQRATKISLQPHLVAQLLVYGQIQNNIMNLKQWIDLFDINKCEISDCQTFATKEREVIPKSFLSTDDGYLYMAQHFYGIQDFLFTKIVVKDNKFTEKEDQVMKLENNQDAHYFNFKRIVVPYEKNQIKQDVASGVSVYDFALKQVWNHQLIGTYLLNILDMIDEKNLIFINQQRIMEFWNIEKNVRTRQIDCEDQIYSCLTYINQFIFLLNQHDEFILWNAADLSQIQQRQAINAQKVVKIELFDKECLILYSNGILELWDVDTGEFRESSVSYPIKDFVLEKDKIMLVGDIFIEIKSRGKI